MLIKPGCFLTARALHIFVFNSGDMVPIAFTFRFFKLLDFLGDDFQALTEAETLRNGALESFVSNLKLGPFCTLSGTNVKCVQKCTFTGNAQR